MAIEEIFGKEYEIRDFYCGNEIGKEIKRKPSVRLYIRLTNSCNAKCKFCLNDSNKTCDNIDKQKLKYVIEYLINKGILNAITITGGEPMLNPSKLNEIVNLIVEICPNIPISISSNGKNILELLKFDNIKKIQAIHISRHHYDDNINSKIFGNDVSYTDEIKRFQEKIENKNTLIINTVMMKDYINSLNEVKKMCNYISKLKISRAHFVSLINYNEYCEKNYVDINSIFNLANTDYQFNKVSDRYRKKFCECHEYIYFPLDSLPITVLARIVKSNNSDYVEQLVYTNENKLITGFDSKNVLI